MHRSGGLLVAATVFVGLLLATGASGALPPTRAGVVRGAPQTRFGRIAGVVPSRRPHALRGGPAPAHVVATGLPAADTSSGPAATDLSYHGGPVMHTSTVHAIYWAPSGYPLTTNYKSAIDGFFQNVANASGRGDNEYSVAAQYGDTTGPGAYQVSFGGSVVDADPYPANGCSDGPLPVCLTDAQLQAEIDKVISAQGWHAGLTNEFFIFTPPSVGSCFDDQGFYCAYGYYCAYHSYFTSALGNGTVIYATEPFGAEPEAPGACDSGPWPSGDDTDPEMDLISHEEIESITDPLVNAWYDGGFQEVADKCVGNFGPNGGSSGIGTGQYYLQEEWSNQTFNPWSGAQGSCVPEDMPQLALTGTGNGTVSGAACSDSICDLSGDVGSTLALTAQPAAGSTFLGWEGDCSGTGVCNVTVARSTSVIARFQTALPAGWAEEPLQSPVGNPLPDFNGDPRFSFFKVAESADGGERAVTIHHVGSACFYGSDYGGIYLERQTSAGWIADGSLSPPMVADEPVDWPSCADFGEHTSLSADGSTLLASQDTVPTIYGYSCAAFVYERGADGWTLAATLFPPGVDGAGSPTWDGCDYYGTDSALSADGTRAVVLSIGRVDIYVRGASGWSLEQHIVLPSGDNCGATVVPSGLAISGDGSRLLVGDPDCTVNGQPNAGRVYDFERVGSSWSLAQTIDVESTGATEFGQGLAISDDGNTAAIATQDNSDLPSGSGAVWVYEHTQAGWQQRVRLTATTPELFALLTCPQVNGNGSTIVCSAYDRVGLDQSQGSVYVFRRPGASWTSAPTPLRLFANDGHAQDRLGSAEYQWLTTGIAVSPTAGDIATTIAASNVGLNGADQIGYEFTTGPVVDSFVPANATAGVPVTITGANFTDATAVTFDGAPASTFTVDSPTEITATVPPTAGVGAIGVTTAKGRGWSTDSFSPVPSISSFAPAVGIAGTHVTIAGTNLLGTTDVEFNGVSAPSFTVSSPTRLTAIVPASATAGVITVVTQGGSGSSSSPFLLRPVILTLLPRWAAATTRLHVEGTNLGGVATVLVAGRSARFVIASPNEIVVRIPKTARGGNVVVMAPTGNAVSPDRFQPIPAISSVEPRTVRPGERFSIVGSNLGGAYRVLVHGRWAHFHVVTPTLIVATVPRQATSGRISVRTWGGSVSSPAALRVR